MVIASVATRSRAPEHVAQTMVRLHAPEHIDLNRGTFHPDRWDSAEPAGRHTARRAQVTARRS
jgi:hypothetical protein